jgi:hypothetical protein
MDIALVEKGKPVIEVRLSNPEEVWENGSY